MLRKFLSEPMGMSRRYFFRVFILLFNTFTWYYATLLVLLGNFADSSQTTFQYRAIYFTVAFATGAAGALVSGKMRRAQFLRFWMMLGAIATVLPILIGNATIPQNILIFSFLGLSFGLGMPSCLAYFANSTVSENRGRTGGVVYFAANFSAIPLAILMMPLSFQTSLMILAVWRGFGAVSFSLLKHEENVVSESKPPSFKSVFQNKPFLLYLLPWCMFALIDIFEKTIIGGIVRLEQYQLILDAQPVISGISALLGGLIADRLGRKRVVIYGFVSLGIAYGIIGIAPQQSPTLWLSLVPWYLYFIIDAVATGMLWVAFILVLWGDLSQSKIMEKYYVIGSAPFLLTEVIPLILILLIPEVTIREVIPPYTAFSVASFFLFIAVLPLMYAPETLPEKKIELRRLKGYIDKAKKVKDTYLDKRDGED